jgi:hypothetical protein
MIKVTNEIREAARQLLTRHNAEEALRAEARYQDELARVESYARRHGMTVTANKAYIRKRASRELPADKDMRKRLEAIIDGKRKQIDASWWKEFFADIDRAKLDAIARMADPARNDKEHERANAARKLAEFKSRRAPGMRPQPPPLAKSAAEWIRRRKVKTPPRMPPQPSSRSKLSDSVADPVSPMHMSDSGAHLNDHNKQRTAARAAKRTGLKCQSCGKPLVAAQRATARYCNATCRSQAWRKIPKEAGRVSVVAPAHKNVTSAVLGPCRLFAKARPASRLRKRAIANPSP